MSSLERLRNRKWQLMLPPCNRCGGWVYQEDGFNSKSDKWCLMCGSWIQPPNFKPLPFVVKNEEPSFTEQSWYIDEHGDIIDIIDKRIEKFISTREVFTVTDVAIKVNCSTSEAYITLQRLIRNGRLEKYTYGPQQRWTGYKRLQENTWQNNNPTMR